MRTGRPKLKIIVSAEDEKLLRKDLRHKDARRRDKARLILEAMQGRKSIPDLAVFIGRARRTAQDWLAKWKQGGYEALMKEIKRPGRPPKLNKEEQEGVKEFLRNGHVRKVAEIQGKLEQMGKKFSLSGVRYWLGKLGRS